MQGNITVAKSWNELNEWQVQEIAHLYLNTPVDDFSEAYQKMILIVFQKSEDKKDVRFFRKLISQVPISELAKHTSWLLETTTFYKFPEIEGLIKPSDVLGNITIKQFSVIDTYFHSWNKNKTLLGLKKLVASLYRLHEKFDDVDLPAVDNITRHLPVKQMEAIALAYLFTRIHITEKFPIVFPKKVESEEEAIKPIFKKKDDDYIPFDKMIIGIAMDELQPLGKKQDANDVRIKEFLSVLSESIIYYQKKAKINAGK